MKQLGGFHVLGDKIWRLGVALCQVECLKYILKLFTQIYLFPLGVSVRRHEKGLWLGVESVRDDAAAKKGGLMKGDFITAINGRIVFHMKPEDVSRLIRNSGKVYQ